MLEGFGADSVVELFSAGVLLWRLLVEAHGRADESAIAGVERRAARLVGFSLLVLAVSMAAMSAYGLSIAPRHTDTHESVWGNPDRPGR